jgi:hypothetical protein|nr:MAG TPA: hypothetical protein [Caudoviricetes sp.]
MAKISWEKEFDRLDAEYMELLKSARKEQLRKLAMELVLEIDNEKWLKNAVIFMATIQNKELKDGIDNYSLVAKEGVA